MALPNHKTKIVCTIGPASDTEEVMEQMIRAGMNIARLNFSHGDFASHQAVIHRLRAAARKAGRRIAILADMPGPKIRIGQFAQEPIQLKSGELFMITTDLVPGDQNQVSTTFEPLPKAVKTGDTIYLNDGFIQLQVVKIQGPEVHCQVLVGGELRSRKGLNLPGIDLGISAFTAHDRKVLQFAAQNGVDAVSQSFVQSSADIEAVRRVARELKYEPLIIAKIERSRALDHIDEIVATADGIMIARGDLGVEIPIEQIAVVQKSIMHKANLLGKPVITATQMLESMTNNRRPTRAESTDVANAILDGTDAVMLSGESAMGLFPVDAVTMLAKIAEAVEPHRPASYMRAALNDLAGADEPNLAELIARSVESVFERISPVAVFVPTHGGYTARRIARFRLPVWIAAVSSRQETCQKLQFSYGVFPVLEPEHPENWNAYVERWLRSQAVTGDLVILTEGPSSKHPERNNRMEIIDLRVGPRRK
ncbi:MAG: pyruvate kinase [Desulfobacteraceae bacterium]|nr:pyruvate kinase [Desulfobacteraceae bacterium]